MATNNVNSATVKIAKILKTRMNKVLRTVNPQVREITQKSLETQLVQSDFYNKVTRSSKFKGELGLERAYYKAYAVINNIIDNIKIKTAHDTNTDKLTINFGGISYSKLLSIPEAWQENSSKNSTNPKGFKRKGRSVVLTEFPWLKWVLTEGSKKVVYNYHLVTPSIGTGRSGFPYLMVRNRKKRYLPDDPNQPNSPLSNVNEQGYRVSEQFQGVERKNLLTESIKKAGPAVIKDIKQKAIPLIRKEIRKQK